MSIVEDAKIQSILERWFPGKDRKLQNEILKDMTEFPSNNVELIEKQLKLVAIRTMPELPGFIGRLASAMVTDKNN